MKLFFLVLLLLLLATQSGFAFDGVSPEGQKGSVTFGGLVDTYISYDLNRQSLFDRAYTSVPARHNEFNVGMAALDANYKSERTRARVAFQAGTAVQAAYRNEPATGTFSGPMLSRNIQEAYAGYRFGEETWVDAGIYQSHIGFESWITKDNWTYSHSLMSDLSPFYQSGIRAHFRLLDYVTLQVNMMNGWQNISENNTAKGFGFRLEFTPNPDFSLTYNTFAGKELGERSRIFQAGRLKVRLSRQNEAAAIYGIGTQMRAESQLPDWWHTGTLLDRHVWSSRVATTIRAEIFVDKDQVLAREKMTPHGFFVWGTSANADYALAENMLARFEVRQLWSRDAIFPSKTSDKSESTSGALSWSLWF